MDIISWNIEFPEKKRLALGQLKPKAKITLETEIGGTEYFFVPPVVARSLKKKEKEGSFSPSLRNEFLFNLKEISAQCIKFRIESLIVKRDYSTYELQKKLSLDGYQKNVINEAVSRAVEVGLINDYRFAEFYVHSKISQGWGPIKIKNEGSKKGIDVESLKGWPELFFENVDQFEVAYRLASRKHLTGKNDFQKLVRFLSSKGYSFSISSSVAKKILNENSSV
ncbi:MAG: regulatory protein RecX [Atopobiaceae bacterium]|nr:regulatory protein RecX [Atopobiaceae bacterium]